MSFFATFIVMSTLWILLSGLFDPLHISLGIISCLFVSSVMHKVMFSSFNLSNIFGLSFRFLKYLPWLIKEVVMSSLDVAYRSLHPSCPINPKIIKFPSNLKTDIGKLILANSITLTPGTVTVDLVNDEFIIHAISHEPADSLLEGEMQRKVKALEWS